MKNLIFITLSAVCLMLNPAFSHAEEPVDDIFMDDGTGSLDIPPDDGGPVMGPTAGVGDGSAETPKASKKEKKAKKTAATSKKETTKETTEPKRNVASVKGGFRVLKTDCALHAEASDDSDTILTAKSSKKLWVEDAGDGWMKGYHKSGSGFFSGACFE